MTYRVLPVVLALGIAGSPVATHAALVGISPAAGFTPPMVNPNDPVNLGDFFYATDSITITALGFYDGAGLSAGEQVSLYNTSQQLLASVFVPTTASQVDNYLFTFITPITLNAGQEYAVVAYTGNNAWGYGGGAPSTPSDIVYVTHQYYYGSNPAYPVNTAGAAPDAYYGPSFEYTNGASIPEPMSATLLLGAVGALATTRRRRR